MATPRSPATDFFGISKTACKAYKSLVTKLHPLSSHRKSDSNADSAIHLEEKFAEDDDLTAARKGLRLQSMDDSSVFKRRSSSLRSNSSSRRSHTPQARPTYLSSSSSSSSNRRSFFSRSTSRGHKSRPVSNDASPMTSSPSPTGKDQTLADLFGDVEGLTSPPPRMITKSRSKRDKENSGSSATSVAFRKSKSTRDTVGSMGRSSTPIVFSQSTPPKKPPAVEKMLECTLEELCHGGVKNIKITRDIITDEGLIMKQEETLRVNIKPGWKKGTKITFEGVGNEKPGYLPEDITFVVEEKRHSLFKSRGDDLEIAVEIPLLKALTGCNLSVPLLSGESMSISVGEVIFHGFEKAIKGQGLPNGKEDGKRGDLIITFLVSFPKELSEEHRSMAYEVLKDCSWA
ncbi:PREDICTED: dnaJ homolog subfamily B member 4 [Brassica oleracea var. oleracea]|uniref:Chaperone DnaJ C-terminal domain-containing protein n=2 Tax=Brassica TaxID=3705 RepID=A0A0D3DP10_BRAOL|nr:PREDICTED: dnaJ homolog subfamily B member 4 [Brassica oleracea var. oleracea]